MTQAQIEEKRQLLEAAQDAEKYYELSQYQPLKKITDDLEKELNLGFLPNDNAVAETPPLIPKKKIRCNRKSNYSSTKVKA